MRLVGLCLLLSCALSTARAQESDASIQGKIIALEKLWNQAYKSSDTKALDSILDDSIVLINDDGSIQTKKEFLASVKATNAQEQQVAPEALKVNVHGNVAIASGVLRVKVPQVSVRTLDANLGSRELYRFGAFRNFCAISRSA
jgi:ketosteroid isomerase-like protein